MLPDLPVGIEDVSKSAGAPANEIEITPEMIKAGVSVLLAGDFRFETHEELIEDILVAALKTHRLAYVHGQESVRNL
jgi:hypothetical protein